MLVLTRSALQTIVIDDDVEVTVLAVDGDRVRLGISAPSAVPVFRTEIYVEIRGEGREPAAPADTMHHRDRSRAGRARAR